MNEFWILGLVAFVTIISVSIYLVNKSKSTQTSSQKHAITSSQKKVIPNVLCKYNKSDNCYTGGKALSYCKSEKAVKDWRLGCSIPRGKTWKDYSVSGNKSPYKSLEECRIFCDKNLNCKSCAKQRNIDNFWYPMSINSKEFNGPVPGGDITAIDVYDKECKSEVLSKCSQAPKLKIKDHRAEIPPWFGYYYLDILNDTFKIGNLLKKTNGVVFVTNWSFNNAEPEQIINSCVEKSLIKLKEMGLKAIILFYPVGHTMRNWLKPSPNSVFKLGKLVKDEKYRSTVLGIMIMDEPLNNLYWIWKNPLSGNTYGNYPYNIYPKNKHYDNKKYISKYLSLAKDVTPTDIKNCKLVTSYADVYALFKTDIELLRDIFGSCMNFIVTFAGEASQEEFNNDPESRFNGRGRPPVAGNRWNQNPAQYNTKKEFVKGGWDMLQMPWSYVVQDIPTINWVGFDWYTDASDNAQSCKDGLSKGPNYRQWKRRQINLLRVLPPSSQSIVVLQSSNGQVGQCGKNTCDKKSEKCVFDYNNNILKFIETHGGNYKFPLQLVYSAPVSCDQPVLDKECPNIWGDSGGKKCFLNSQYQKGKYSGRVLGNTNEVYDKKRNYYKCFFDLQDAHPPLAKGITCPYEKPNNKFQCRDTEICGFDKSKNKYYFIDMHCGSKDCFFSSPNTVGLINNAAKNTY